VLPSGVKPVQCLQYWAICVDMALHTSVIRVFTEYSDVVCPKCLMFQICVRRVLGSDFWGVPLIFRGDFPDFSLLFRQLSGECPG
jgi:hypothetical protein